MEAVENINNYRQWLYQEFSKRKAKNPALSLRAFSSRLNISPAALSQIISGKRKLTKKSAQKISDKLNLSPLQRRELFKSIHKKNIEEFEDEYQTLEMDTFKIISDWYHYAILSLSELKGSKANMDWISQKLGILKKEAEDAYQRLLKLKIIEEKNGKFKQVSLPLTTRDDVNSSAIRQYLYQYLKKAEEAIETLPIEELQFYTVVMAGDPKNLKKAGASIKKFRRSLSQTMEHGKKSRVYALSVQLFPIDKEGVTP
jgi:uncharacterized protein (TIGR02147 family)